MGEMTCLKCKHCDYRLGFLAGHGLEPPVHFNVNWRYQGGKKKNWARHFFYAHPEGAIDSSQCLVRCPTCGGILSVTKETQYYELTEKGKSLWDEKVQHLLPQARLEEAYAHAVPYEHICPGCGSVMEIVADWHEAVRDGRLRCPLCDGELEEEDIGTWD